MSLKNKNEQLRRFRASWKSEFKLSFLLLLGIIIFTFCTAVLTDIIKGSTFRWFVSNLQKHICPENVQNDEETQHGSADSRNDRTLSQVLPSEVLLDQWRSIEDDGMDYPEGIIDQSTSNPYNHKNNVEDGQGSFPFGIAEEFSEFTETKVL